MATLLWIVLLTTIWDRGSATTCNFDGELLPNTEDCRKYFKCANGAASKQVCPGTLIFDTKLKICNWPQSTSCNIKPKPVKLDEDDLLSFLSGDGPTAPTAKPTTERNKEKFESLFHTKDRDFVRLRDRHKNLRDRMRERARKEEEAEKEEKSTQRSRGSSFRNEEDDDEALDTRSFRNRGSSRSRNRGNEDETSSRESSFGNRGSGNRNRGSSFDDDEDDIGLFRSRGSTGSRNRGDLDEKLSRDELRSKLKNKFSIDLTDRNRGSNSREDDEDNDSVETSSFRNRGSTGSRTREDLDTSSFRNRGSSVSRNRGDQSARDKLRDKLRNKFSIDLEDKAPKKERNLLEPIECDHDNELHANPMSCHKYFKCSNGQPSMQSCPPNLIFDSSLGVCNWPEATDCDEDPDAEFRSSPSKPKKTPSRNDDDYDYGYDEDEDEDDYDAPFFAPEPPRRPPKPSPNQGRKPSKSEAMEREQLLKDEYPLFAKVRETVRTLHTDEVEKIQPKRKENPDNVKRVEFILSEDNYEELFPRRHPSYTYTRFIQV